MRVCVTAVLMSIAELFRPEQLPGSVQPGDVLPASQSNQIIQFDVHCRKDVRPEQPPGSVQPGDVLPASESNQIIQFDVHFKKDIRPEQQASPV